MTAVAVPTSAPVQAHRPDTLLSRAMQSRRVVIGGGVLAAIVLTCVLTLIVTLNPASDWYYNGQKLERKELPHDGTVVGLFGYDKLGRSILSRSLLGGTMSLGVGLAAASISLVLGVSVGLLSGYMGGWVDSVLMRFVDIMYGLPYILLVILFKVALERPLGVLFDSTQTANVVVMFLSIGLVSWLTLSRVVRGQVLSIRSMPYIEACRAMGMRKRRIFILHVLPNLIGPITVYATLTVPSAILQESFLSFLGVGVQPPLPTWGSLAADGVAALSPVRVYWWMLLYPCLLLMATLLSLNFMGDGLRDLFDPKREAAKI